MGIQIKRAIVKSLFVLVFLFCSGVLAIITPIKYATVDSAVPVGAVMAFGRINCPTGWIVADGSAISRTTYSALFAATGTIHGTGDGSTTFHLPDYRGRFLRGADGGTGRDPNAVSRTAMNTGGNSGSAVGSIQNDALQAHKHSSTSQIALGPAPGAFNNGPNAGPYSSTTNFLQTVMDGYVADGANGTPRVSPETRPLNAAVLYCIKI